VFALILFLVALLVLSTLFALVEIHIEGDAGWAASLPTWRIQNRWTRLFYGSRALTGYHLYVQLFVLGMVHLPFLLSLTPVSWRAEARILAFMILFWILEDFLWFVLNPKFGIRRFRKEHVPWHAPTWWWLMPRDYWLFLPVAVWLMWVSGPWE
jgi:hypothetical protein